MDSVQRMDALNALNVSVGELRRHTNALKGFALDQRLEPVKAPTNVALDSSATASSVPSAGQSSFVASADTSWESWRHMHARTAHVHVGPGQSSDPQPECEVDHRARALEMACAALDEDRGRLRSELNALSMELAAARRDEERALLQRTELETLVREIRGALFVATAEASALKADLATQVGLVSSLENWKSAPRI